jgi:hypothetical protein
MNQATFVVEVTVVDPDSKGDVQLSVFKHENGGMFAVDSSFLDQCFDDDVDPLIPDPFFTQDCDPDCDVVVLRGL